MTDLDPAAVDKCKHLWTTDKADYIPLRIDDDEDTNLLVVNITQSHPEAKMFFDDRLSARIKQRMIDAGVPIVTQRELDDDFPRPRAEIAGTRT